MKKREGDLEFWEMLRQLQLDTGIRRALNLRETAEMNFFVEENIARRFDELCESQKLDRNRLVEGLLKQVLVGLQTLQAEDVRKARDDEKAESHNFLSLVPRPLI